MNENVLGGILAMSVGVIILVFALIIAMYVLWALAVSKALKMMGSDWAWMAWVPLLSTIALAREANDGTGNVNMFGQLVPINLFMFWPLIHIAIGWLPVVGGIAALAFSIICGGLMYRTIYAKCEGRREQDMLAIGILSGLFPIIALVKFLSYKKTW